MAGVTAEITSSGETLYPNSPILFFKNKPKNLYIVRCYGRSSVYVTFIFHLNKKLVSPLNANKFNPYFKFIRSGQEEKDREFEEYRRRKYGDSRDWGKVSAGRFIP